MADIYEKLNELYDKRRKIELGGGDDCAAWQRRIRKCDIVVDRAVEQKVLLQDDSDLAA